MKKCTHCGADLPDTALFCGFCGAKQPAPDTKQSIVEQQTQIPAEALTNQTAASMLQKPETANQAPQNNNATQPILQKQPDTQQTIPAQNIFQPQNNPAQNIPPQNNPAQNISPQQTNTPQDIFAQQANVAPNAAQNIPPQNNPAQNISPQQTNTPQDIFAQQANVAPNAAQNIPPQNNPAQNILPQQPNTAQNILFQNTSSAEQNAAFSTTPQQANYYPNQNGQTVPQQPLPPKKKSKTGLIVGIAALFLVFVAAVAALVFGSKKTVSLNDYVKIEYGGFDSKGTAEVKLDRDELTLTIVKAKDKSQTRDTMDIYLLSHQELDDAIFDFEDSIKFDVSKSSELSNNDSITIEIKYDAKAASDVGLKIKTEPITTTVKGLDEFQSIDPFDQIDVEFSGSSPSAYANIRSKEISGDVPLYMYSGDFTLSKEDGLKLGDEITVTVTDYAIEQAETAGVKFTETSKTYTCEGVESIAMIYKDIQDDTLNSMKKKAEKLIQSEFVDKATDLSVTDIQYYGAIMLTPKNEDNYYYRCGGICTLVYTATLAPGDGTNSFEPRTTYIPLEFSSIVTDTKNKQTFEDPYGIDGYYFIDGTDFNFYSAYGYENEEEMRKAVIDERVDEYDAKCFGKLK